MSSGSSGDVTEPASDASPVTGPPGFPPARHVYRDLGLTTVLSDCAGTAALAAGPWTHGPGGLAPGPLLTALDVLAGAVVGRTVAPDWLATSSLELHLLDTAFADAPIGRDAAAAIDLGVTVVRTGRTTVVTDLVASRSGIELAIGTATFARLPRRSGNLAATAIRSVGDGPVVLDGGDQRWASTFDSVIEPVDRGGRPALEAHDHLRNSVGSVNGGVLAAFAELVGRRSVGAGGDGIVTTDVEVHFLRAARQGPFAAEVRTLPRRDGTLALVELFDETDAPPGPGSTGPTPPGPGSTGPTPPGPGSTGPVLRSTFRLVGRRG